MERFSVCRVRDCSACELPLQRSPEARGDACVAQPGLQALRFAGHLLLGLFADVFEQSIGDLATLSLGPTTNDPTVRPDRGSGVAGAVEQRRSMRTEIPIAADPAHHRGVHAGGEGDPWGYSPRGFQSVPPHEAACPVEGYLN